MDKPSRKSHLAQGIIELTSPSGHVEVHYFEHEERNGRLLVSVEGNPLGTVELFALAENLQQKELKLAEGRRRYADMAMAYWSLQHLDPDSDENAPGGTDS